MVAALLDAGRLDPTVINGGIINAYGTNARMGEGEWMVVEADESDGTFTSCRRPSPSSPTSIPSTSTLRHGRGDERGVRPTFVENMPFYGFAVLCIDHPEVQALIPQVSDRRIITYGFNPQADVAPSTCVIGRAMADVRRSSRDRKGERPGVTMHDLFLPMLGEHNVQNALAAIAVARELGVTTPASAMA
jgi:UDP-N-acetylmuramate--alanine ligase